MGRHGVAHPANEYKVYIHRLPLDAGGYDQGGAYWGLGSPLFRIISADSEFCAYRRARSRDACILALREEFPNLTFYRGHDK
jgi:hypothetical protein